MHAADSGMVQHRRFCEAEDREIPYEEVGRGWELPDGQLVPLTDQDLDRLPLATRHVVQVLGFVPGQDIDPISYSRPYYVGPDGSPAERPYALLVEALARTGQAGVCKVAVRSRERIALLRPRHGILILHTLLWQDELRDPGDLAPSAPVTDRELELAEVLMRELPGVEVGQLRDEYRHALEQLVEAKVSGGQLSAPAQARTRDRLDGRTGRVSTNRAPTPEQLSDWRCYTPQPSDSPARPPAPRVRRGAGAVSVGPPTTPRARSSATSGRRMPGRASIRSA
ncbi:Ku protein [Streptomyces sp. NPDC058686]|uniref:non-homologous end joining protein Ku n=1 Tax=Streptomyces sp. NPDC058686 TaxID=3346599 RepID=UPI00366687D1